MAKLLFLHLSMLLLVKDKLSGGAWMHVSAVWTGHELIGNFTAHQLTSHVLSASLSIALHQQLKDSQIKPNNLNHKEFKLYFLLRSRRLKAPTLHTFQGLLGIATGDGQTWYYWAQICGIWENFHFSLNPTVLKSRVVWQSCDINWIFVFSSYWDLLLVITSVKRLKARIIQLNLNVKLILFFTELTGKTWLPGSEVFSK